MKKLILFLSLLLIIPVGVWALMSPGMGGGGVSGCSTPSTGDELNEGFLGAGYENTWAETNNPDEDHALPGSPPSECCSEGLRSNGSGTTAIYATHDLGSGLVAPVDIIIYFYINSVTIGVNYDFIRFAQFDDETTVWNIGVCDVTIKLSTADYRLYVNGATTVDLGIVSTGTWYKLTLHLDSAAASSYAKLDSGSNESFTRNSVNGRYYRLGYIHDLEAGESLDIDFGYTYVNTP